MGVRRGNTLAAGAAAIGSIARRALLVGLSLLVPVAAFAQEEQTEEELARWVPSATLGFSFHFQSLDTSGAEVFAFGAVPSGSPQDQSPYTSSVTTDVLASTFDIDLALSSPALVKGWGAPRAFVHTAVHVPLSSEFTILEAPKSFRQPIGFANPETRDFCPVGENVENVIEGGAPTQIGTCDHRMTAKLTINAMWALGVGAEFVLPVWDRPLRVRTGVDYIGQSLEFSGEATRSDRQTQQGGAAAVVNREYTVSTSKVSHILHSIGPTIAFEAEAARVDDLSLNVFLEGRFYWLIDNPLIEYSGTNSDGNVEFLSRPHPFTAQLGAGVRFSWRGGI